MNKLVKNKKSIYILFAFISIIFFYLSINILYTQTSYTNDLPNAERFVNNINVSVSKTNNNEILIEWEGISDNNLIYYVYRNESPITGKYSLVNSKVVDYIKATNTSRKYSIIDRPVMSSTYYYAVVSYIDDLSFYNAKVNVDTLSIIFNGGLSNNNTSSDIILEDTNYNNIFTNVHTVTNFVITTNTVTNFITTTNTVINNKLITNIVTNFITATNTVINSKLVTNTVTNFYIVTNTVISTNNNPVTKGNTVNNNGEYGKYKSDYDRAVAQFKAGNYLSAVSILEPISRRNINKTLYYDINLLLGKCYKNLGRKKNALDVFKRIKTYNAQEVNFWINQVLTDL